MALAALGLKEVADENKAIALSAGLLLPFRRWRAHPC
jgi:hypothetical protein